MAINKATISTDVWDTIYGILNVASLTNNAKLCSAYAKSFTKNASNKDFVVLYKPEITEEPYTLTGKKTYNVSMDIEIVCSEEEQLKVLSDAVRNLLESGKGTTRGAYLFNFRVTGDRTAYEIRDNRRILRNIMTVEYYRRGDT